MKALIFRIQGTGSVSHAKSTFTTNTAAYCRKEAPVKIIKVKNVQSDQLFNEAREIMLIDCNVK